jgi:hypothetical protein
MTAEERGTLLPIWNALVVFASLIYFSGTIVRPALVAAVVLISSALGYGSRWLYRAGFVLMAFTIANVSGLLPPIEQWPNLMENAQAYIVAFGH